MAWIYLLIAGFFEMAFAISMKMMDSHKNIPWTISFYICILASFFFLNLAIKHIPIGTAYAIWTGIGASGVAIIGIYFFKDPVTIARVGFLMLLVISIIGLKITSE